MSATKNSSIGYLLVQICKTRRNQTNALLSAAGIHAGQDVLLYYLGDEDGQTVSSLVEKMCIQHATISNMIDRMEANDLVKKKKDTADRRASRVYLTATGKDAVKEVHNAWRTLEKQTTKGLTQAQKDELAALLTNVLQNLS
jgi:DNA-binding MarR family transcriptional regulator